MAPVPELEGQRFDEQQVAAQEIAANSEQILENVSGTAVEIEAVIRLQRAALAGRRGQTRISFFTALQDRAPTPAAADR